MSSTLNLNWFFKGLITWVEMELCRRSIRTQDVNLLLFHTKGVIVFATIHSSIRLGIWKNKDNDHNISSLSRRLRTVSLSSVKFLDSLMIFNFVVFLFLLEPTQLAALQVTLISTSLFFMFFFFFKDFKGAMSPMAHALASETKLEKGGLSFSSSVGDLGRRFLVVEISAIVR